MSLASSSFFEALAGILQTRGVDLNSPQTLARKILTLSDFYAQNPGEHTPWSEPYAADAYLSYFLPLNYARLQATFQEVKRFLPMEAISEIWDFGAGIGTTQWVLENEPAIAPRRLQALERSREAIAIYRELLDEMPPRWNVEFTTKANPGARALGVFSYSFLEMQDQLPDLSRFEHLLIVEPSTRDCARALMESRTGLMEKGFTPLAPCTHSQACPLLIGSNKDWCHMRIPLNAPDWWRELETHLPMKNRTLTYSYLLMSRTVTDEQWRGTARAIGDTLEENGKTRQMICRGPKREFLSWLHKFGPAPQIPHGALIRGVDLAEAKGAELRAAPDSLEWTI